MDNSLLWPLWAAYHEGILPPMSLGLLYVDNSMFKTPAPFQLFLPLTALLVSSTGYHDRVSWFLYFYYKSHTLCQEASFTLQCSHNVERYFSPLWVVTFISDKPLSLPGNTPDWNSCYHGTYPRCSLMALLQELQLLHLFLGKVPTYDLSWPPFPWSYLSIS